MPRNGSGVYALPSSSWNPAVSGTTIEANAANTTLTDLASAMTQSISSDGQTLISGNLQMGNNKLTGLADGSASTDSMSYGQGAKLTGGNTFTGTQIITSTTSGATAGPTLDLYRNSAGSVSNLLGSINFNGNNSSSAKTLYSRIVSEILDPTAASEDGALAIQNIVAGANTTEVLIGGGVLLGGASGGAQGVGTVNATGLYFNGTAFYETGTFTPGMTVNGSATGITFATQLGRYTRIGNIVTARMRIVLSSNGANTGAVVITGLPFTAAGGISVPGVLEPRSGFSGMTGAPILRIDTATSSAQLFQGSASGETTLTDTNVTDSASFGVTITYEV